MLRRVSLAIVGLGALWIGSLAQAQSVLVLWGDSVVCGFGADACTSTPYGPSPFGDPIPDAWRWDEAGQRWIELTPLQNHQGTGADPAYGVAAGWRAMHRSSGPLFVVALGIPGADVTPMMSRNHASWSPNVAGSAFHRFVSRSLRPALASLAAPRVELVCGSAGNNVVPDWSQFQSDLGATWEGLLAQLPNAPRTLMLRSYCALNVNSRSAIDASGYVVVNLDQLPARTDGLQRDGVHLTHYGNVCAGARVAVTAALVPLPSAPSAVEGEGANVTAGPAPLGPGGKSQGPLSALKHKEPAKRALSVSTAALSQQH
ncbi:MAG: hypothetical protein R3F49_16780 [Planctomycetota bacterium]